MHDQSVSLRGQRTKTDRILITGSEGVIGSALQKALAERGYVYVYGCDLKRIKRDNYFLADIVHYDSTNRVFFEVLPSFVFHL